MGTVLAIILALIASILTPIVALVMTVVLAIEDFFYNLFCKVLSFIFGKEFH